MRRVTGVGETGGPRVLCVIAHPDDETGFVGLLYKSATHLDGACDIVTITNGEGGFKYATLSERIYRLELTDEKVGRAELPRIRERELVASCRILGVRNLYLLDQTDHRYTQDADEVLAPEAGVWDLALVRRELARLMRAGAYDFVLTLAPLESTHGHHKAATILALEAVSGMPEDQRPIVLGVRGSAAGQHPPPPSAELAGYPLTRPAADAPPFVFDRTQTFGHRDRLSYQVVVNWVIAEHKSQGTMQLAMNRRSHENYHLYAFNPPGSVPKARAFFEALAEPQFETREYGESAGTNAGVQ